MSKTLVKLGDVCIKDSSNIAQKDLINLEGLYPIYGASGFIKNINQFNQDKPYVAIVKDGAGVGRAMYLPAYSSVIGTLQYILPKDSIDSKYLFYAISFMDLTKYAKGATIPHIYFKEYKEELLNLPDLETQQKIVAKLDNLNLAIDKCKRLLELHDELIKSKFYEMFGDPVVNEKGWEVYNFEDITEIITDGEHSTPKRTERGIYLLSARNVLNHSLTFDDVDYIDEDEYNRISKRIIPQNGDILLSCSGTVGRCCSVKSNIKFQMVRSVALLRFNSAINPIFAEYLITSDELQNQIKSSSTKTAQANLFQGKIKKLKGFVPPLQLQTQFAQYVETVETSKTKIKELQSRIEYLKASYMQEYFA